MPLRNMSGGWWWSPILHWDKQSSADNGRKTLSNKQRGHAQCHSESVTASVFTCAWSLRLQTWCSHAFSSTHAIKGSPDTQACYIKQNKKPQNISIRSSSFFYDSENILLKLQVSKLVFYAQSTSVVISGWYTFCHHILLFKSVLYMC